MSDTANAAAAATNPTTGADSKPEVKDTPSADVAASSKANGDGEEKKEPNGKSKDRDDRDRRGGRDDRDRKDRRGGDRKGRGDAECYNCKKTGHMSYDCSEERRGGDRNSDRRGGGRGRGRGGFRGGGSGNMNYQKYAPLIPLGLFNTDSHAQAQQRVREPARDRRPGRDPQPGTSHTRYCLILTHTPRSSSTSPPTIWSATSTSSWSSTAPRTAPSPSSTSPPLSACAASSPTPLS